MSDMLNYFGVVIGVFMCMLGLWTIAVVGSRMWTRLRTRDYDVEFDEKEKPSHEAVAFLEGVTELHNKHRGKLTEEEARVFFLKYVGIEGAGIVSHITRYDLVAAENDFAIAVSRGNLYFIKHCLRRLLKVINEKEQNGTRNTRTDDTEP